MKKIRPWKHEKEFDTKTLMTDSAITASDIAEHLGSSERESAADGSDEQDRETRKAVDLKEISDARRLTDEETITQVYEPRPLTPDDDIYDDIIEQFASAPTKPKYWFEEFGDYWSCSCGHINKGDICKSCGLERDLLRSLFILHKPAGAQGNLSKKLSKTAREKIDKEEQQQNDRDNRRKKLDDLNDDELRVMPIEPDAGKTGGDITEGDANDNEGKNNSAAKSETSDDNQSDSSDSSRKTPSTKDAAASQKETNGHGHSADASSSAKAAAHTNDTGKSKDHKGNKKNATVNTTSDSSGNALTPVPVAHTGKKKRDRKFKIKIIVAIFACLLLIALAGFVIYRYMAAPAMQYQDAIELQADGKYEKAIDKFESLGDYKDCEERIWECYCSMGDRYFKEGDYEAAIETYNIAIDLKDDESLHDKIWQCYCGIGDDLMDAKEYEQALSTYYIAADMKDNEEIQDKINLAKFSYVKAYQDDRTAKVEDYMSDLMTIKYPGIQDIYDSYYAWHVNIVANTSADDASTDVSTVSRKDTVYFHVSLSGGEPSEQILLYYEVIWPNGNSEIYNLDSTWESGSTITARFQYPIPLFGKEGKLTFKLYDKSTNEVMGSDSVTFKN